MADGNDKPTGDNAADSDQQNASNDDANQQDGQSDSTGTQSDDQQDQSADKGDDKPDLKAEIAKWKAIARKHESRVKELVPLASKLKEIEDSQKSEIDKAKDRETALQVELQRYKVAEIRRAAASAAGLDPELAEFITAADEEEATEQAKKLAERLKVTSKSSPDLKQGTRQSPAPTRSRDELLRGLAGFGGNR